MIKGYIFDLDGTLLDSEVLWVESVEILMKANECALSHEEAITIVYGKSWGSIYEELNARIPGVYPTMEAMSEALNRKYKRLCATRDIRIHSSIQLLKKLARDFPVCIVSGSTRKDVEEGMALAAIEAFVDFYLGTEDYAAGKPDPACYRIAAQRLNLPPAECLVFEDSQAGVAAAKAAGMTAVALKRQGAPAQDFSMADQVLDDLGDFQPGAFG